MKKILRLPTILGFLLLLSATGAGVVLIRQVPGFILKAAPEIVPQQIKITNLTNNGFSVSWITDEQTSGLVKHGSEATSFTSTAGDDRDQLSGTTNYFFTHHATLKNLKPTTNYYFEIVSGGKTFNNNGEPYQIKTAPPLETAPPPNDTAYGIITASDGSNARGVIVYLSLANTAPLSALTQSSGSWVVPLNLARSLDLSSYASYDREASIEEIFVQGGSLGTATAIATTKSDSPLPKIILGQNFDFRKTVSEEESSPETPSTSKFTFEEIGPPKGETGSADRLRIINPGSDEEVNSFRPEVIGKGPAGTTLSITIESPSPSKDTVEIDSQGNWRWTPSVDLEPGEHTVTVNYLDEETSEEQAASRRFFVLTAQASELPAFTATPSGTLTPSPSPSPSPTPPEASPTPTSTISPSPTASPDGRVSIPSTEEGVPTPGVLTPTFVVFMMGLVLTTLGGLATLISSRKNKLRIR